MGTLRSEVIILQKYCWFSNQQPELLPIDVKVSPCTKNQQTEVKIIYLLCPHFVKHYSCALPKKTETCMPK